MHFFKKELNPIKHLKSYVKIGYLFIFLCFLLLSCYSSKKSVKLNQETYKPIIKTEEVANLTNEQEKLVRAAIIEDIQLYTESCEKIKKIKTTLNQTVFIEVLGKNPSRAVLSFLNKKFDANKKFLAAKDGVAIFSSGLLIGYKNLRKQDKGYLISVSIKDHNNRSASIDLSESRASLGGVYK